MNPLSEESLVESTPLVNRQESCDSTRSSISFIDASFVHRQNSSSRLSDRLLNHVSSSARERALKDLGVGPAAFLIREAVRGEKEGPYEAWYDPYAHPEQPFRNLISLLCGKLICSSFMTRLFSISIWSLVLISFIEPPYWCRNSDLPIAEYSIDEKFGTCGVILRATGEAADGEQDVDYYPNSNAMWLTLEQSAVIELICLVIISIFMILKFGRDGFEINRFFYPGYNRRMHTLRVVLLVTLYVALFSKATMYSPFLRLLLLGTYLKKFQKELRSLVKMLPQLLYILLLLAILILFYGWFGVVMFYGTEQGARDFSNLIEGCWTMWQCVTTVNYPDVMMPSYNDNRLSGIFFVSFMIISFFFLMNLVLASAVNAYEEVIGERKKSRKEIAQENLTKAFEILDKERTGLVSRESIMALFMVLSEDFPELRAISSDEAKLLFGFLDKDGSSTINLTEFQDFGGVFLLEFTRESDYATFVQVRFPKIYESPGYKKFCDVVRSAGFEYVVDFVLVLNAIVIGIQSYPELSGKDVQFNPHYSDGYIDTKWELMETIFTIVYMVEALLRIMVDGWKKYSESMRNIFDFIITVSAIFATAYVYYPNDYSDSRLIRFVVMARVLRLLRLLMTISTFQDIGTISAEILPAAMHVITVLFFLMYFFAAMGTILYGGMVTRDPANPLSYLILGNAFSDNDYWANNFNDMISAMNVLFNLLVINNWTNCEIGFEAVTEGKWVRLYFLAFYVLGVILVNNLVVAYIINAFFQQLATLQSRKAYEDVVEGEAIIRGERAIFDSSEITGTETGISGGYIARIRSRHNDVEVDEREGLRRLFTRNSSDMSKGKDKQ